MSASSRPLLFHKFGVDYRRALFGETPERQREFRPPTRSARSVCCPAYYASGSARPFTTRHSFRAVGQTPSTQSGHVEACLVLYVGGGLWLNFCGAVTLGSRWRHCSDWLDSEPCAGQC
ncbi:hypothetical protein GCM10010094_46390 [Streptomyces flaveus]|uniref:Uncharacterized protein n=1 Tax=Streptomyces flaveus TaxID=66370 RepID=A0A917R0L9_9ACTN|nr:hypothetical protein GCM10010094_46390 [Streptomyces flaveus]